MKRILGIIFLMVFATCSVYAKNLPSKIGPNSLTYKKNTVMISTESFSYKGKNKYIYYHDGKNAVLYTKKGHVYALSEKGMDRKLTFINGKIVKSECVVSMAPTLIRTLQRYAVNKKGDIIGKETVVKSYLRNRLVNTAKYVTYYKNYYKNNYLVKRKIDTYNNGKKDTTLEVIKYKKISQYEIMSPIIEYLLLR